LAGKVKARRLELQKRALPQRWTAGDCCPSADDLIFEPVPHPVGRMAAEVNMVLGGGARERGALADQIPALLPGVGYVLIPGQPEPARVRFSWISDGDIHDLTNFYPAPHHQEPPAHPPVTIPVQPTGPAPSRDGYRWTPPQEGTGGGHPVVPDSLLRKLRGDR
jgi:hypothetical protein